MAGHPHGLLGHVRHRGVSWVRVMLGGQHIRWHLWQRGPWQVGLRTREHMRL